MLKLNDVQKDSTSWKLTEQGSLKSKKLVRLHRLWELYLSEYMQIAPDHVHEDADSIEHILTDEIQDKLEALLVGNTTDPHNKQLPEIN